MGSSYIEAAQELRNNSGQWQVYESMGHCVAMAGPGSGKTKTLTIKLARMRATEVSGSRGIACITFNNECVREIERRLNRLGVRRSSNLFLGTIHRFCLSKIVIPYGKMAGLDLPEPLKIATQKAQEPIFRSAVEEVFGNPREMKRPEMNAVRLKIMDRESELWRPDDEPVFNVVLAYERLLRAGGFIDFDDMVLMGQHLVRSYPWIRRLIKARFPIFIIDEYQDLGVPLHEIVMSLCIGEGIRLLAVGDPDQSIYGFTGAEPALLRQLSELDEVESVSMRLNYRCGKTIVRASEGVLKIDEGSFGTPENAEEGTVDKYLFPEGIEQQATEICRTLIPEVLDRLDDCTLGEIAVLYIDKNDGDVIARAATKAGYDHIRIDENAPYKKTRLTRWLEDCAEWSSGGWRLGKPQLSTIINSWMQFKYKNRNRSDAALRTKRRLVRFLWENRDQQLALGEWLDEFTEACLSEVIFENCEFPDEFEALSQLKASCLEGQPLENFTVATFGGQGGAPNHLNLITLFRAKGLEFKAVFLMGMDQGRIPWSSDSAIKVAEKRRLFYVGVTRAKFEVHITYSGWYEYFGVRKELGESEFIHDLLERIG